MKYRHILLTSLLLLAASLQAKPVDPTLLLRAAQHVLQRTDVVDVTPATFTDCRLFVGADGRGFVLLSDDDCVRPLLGYSVSGQWPVAGAQMPEHVMAWIEGYQREIASVKALGADPSERARDEWRQLLGERVAKTLVTPVEPLVKTNWGQGDYYNNMCPYDSAFRKRCATGCVATATAQVMRYWKHPATGRGSHSYTHATYGTLDAVFDTVAYNWTRMPNDFLGVVTQGRIAAVSQLMYHVGVSVDMNYGPNASGAHTNPLGNVRCASAETALKEYFRYNPALFAAYKENYSDAGWRALIDGDLEAARPIIYDGYGTGGHAFVLDGRDSLGLYHFNWGWDGMVNGYFTLDSLSPVSNSSFSRLNAAIVHIYPITVNDEVAQLNAVSSDPSRGTVSGGGTYSVDSLRVLLLATAKPGYRFDHWTSGNTANPIITSPTNDFGDTAVFIPMHRDSVGYCRNNGIAYKKLTGQDSSEWGIRIPYLYLEGKQRLREVQFWTYEAAGPYYLHLYRGELPSDDNLFYTDSLMAFGYGMNIYPIPDDLAIDFTDTTPLWVTIYSKGSPYPMSYSHFTGTADGSWVRYDSVWQPVYEALHVYGSWMLRALLDPSTHVGIPDVVETPMQVSVIGRTVTVTADGPVSVYDVMGRKVASSTSHLSPFTFRLPAAGLYVLRSATASKKIIVF